MSFNFCQRLTLLRIGTKVGIASVLLSRHPCDLFVPNISENCKTDAFDPPCTTDFPPGSTRMSICSGSHPGSTQSPVCHGYPLNPCGPSIPPQDPTLILPRVQSPGSPLNPPGVQSGCKCRPEILGSRFGGNAIRRDFADLSVRLSPGIQQPHRSMHDTTGERCKRTSFYRETDLTQMSLVFVQPLHLSFLHRLISGFGFVQVPNSSGISLVCVECGIEGIWSVL